MGFIRENYVVLMSAHVVLKQFFNISTHGLGNGDCEVPDIVKAFFSGNAIGSSAESKHLRPLSRSLTTTVVDHRLG